MTPLLSSNLEISEILAILGGPPCQIVKKGHFFGDLGRRKGPFCGLFGPTFWVF
jgi:hypothetical protein